MDDDWDDILMQQVKCVALVVDQWQKREQEQQHRGNNRLGCVNIHRAGKSVETVFNEMGERCFRRAFRMWYEDFRELCRLLEPHLNSLSKSRGTKVRISNKIKIACALRYFAGGAIYDLLVMFGISESSIYNCVSMVVEAVHNCPQLGMGFPSNHDEQRMIAQEYEKKSGAGFKCCAGAIDGLMIWIHKPSKDESETSQVGEAKYFCARKSKFALNMQAVVDHHSRFLDVSIVYGGATSDLLSFEASTLYGKLENESLLAPELCIFGDNAYINTQYMATPFPGGNLTQAQDAYNFYHSQLRITSECGFGRLIPRWGFLQKKAPEHYSITKIISTVVCLCKLHNFCTNAALARGTTLDPPETYERDAAEIRSAHGGIRLGRQYVEELQHEAIVPIQLMDGGHHMDGQHRHNRRTLQRRRNAEAMLPRDLLCAEVAAKDLRQPQLPNQTGN